MSDTECTILVVHHPPEGFVSLKKEQENQQKEKISEKGKKEKQHVLEAITKHLISNGKEYIIEVLMGDK